MKQTNIINKNKFALKMTGIICFTILSIITIIDLFWGREGMLIISLLILVISVIFVFSTINTF